MIKDVLNKPRLVQTFPNACIYFWSENKTMHPVQQDYQMFSLDKKKLLGSFHCHTTNLELRDDYNGEMLAVDFITTTEHEKGYGKTFIDFIKHLSHQLGCNGYIVLKATTIYSPQRIPHLFYRKLGFSTLNEAKDKEMDSFINQNKDATSKDFRDMLMFYPPYTKKEQTPSLKEKIKNFFSKFFNI